MLKQKFCNVTDAAKVLSIGRSKTYELIKAGNLKSITIGRRRLVSVESIDILARGTERL